MARIQYAKARTQGPQRDLHRVIAEKALGKPLPPGAEVHHVDGNGLNNDPSNLVICPDRAYHKLLHARQRAMDATGDPNQRPCLVCGKYDQPENMAAKDRSASGRQPSFIHPTCSALRERLKRAAKKTMAAATLALAACGGGGTGGAPPVIAAAPVIHNTTPAAPVPCTVSLWGDSIAALTAPLLDSRIQVTQHVVIGGTAAAALAQFLQDPLAPLVVVSFGTNDANGNSDLIAPVSSMLQRTTSLGDRPVLTGIPQEVVGQLAVEANYNLWLSSQGTAYANWPAVAYAGASDTMADGVHPAAAYQQRLADALSATILQICTP